MRKSLVKWSGVPCFEIWRPGVHTYTYDYVAPTKALSAASKMNFHPPNATVVAIDYQEWRMAKHFEFARHHSFMCVLLASLISSSLWNIQIVEATYSLFIIMSKRRYLYLLVTITLVHYEMKAFTFCDIRWPYCFYLVAFLVTANLYSQIKIKYNIIFTHRPSCIVFLLNAAAMFMIFLCGIYFSTSTNVKMF